MAAAALPKKKTGCSESPSSLTKARNDAQRGKAAFPPVHSLPTPGETARPLGSSHPPPRPRTAGRRREHEPRFSDTCRFRFPTSLPAAAPQRRAPAPIPSRPPSRTPAGERDCRAARRPLRPSHPTPTARPAAGSPARHCPAAVAPTARPDPVPPRLSSLTPSPAPAFPYPAGRPTPPPRRRSARLGARPAPVREMVTRAAAD